MTSAVERAVPLLKIATPTRHQSLDVLGYYARFAQRFESHPGEGFL